MKWKTSIEIMLIYRDKDESLRIKGEDNHDLS